MITFARGGFNESGQLFHFMITDLKVGPDGYLYVLAANVLAANPGKIFRTVPRQ
jgi:hypothetical protein